MTTATRLLKSLARLFLPAIFLILTGGVSGALWLIYTSAHPLNSPYLVSPNKYGQLSSRAAQVTDETWSSGRDGSQSRGWLLRGAENAPAVILYHKFGADRSHVLDLGVKLNESTDFTVLMPDLRAHGENPPVKNASFGGCETEDSLSAIEYLRSLKSQGQVPLVGKNIGIFGIEMGAMVAIATAAKDVNVKAIAVDSVPQDSDSLLKESVGRRFPFARVVTTRLAQLGTRLYYFDGCYQRENVFETARKIENRNLLVLAGVDEPDFQESSARLTKSFPVSNKLDAKLDLSPSGYSIVNASMEQSAAYDQRLIDFFRNSLSN